MHALMEAGFTTGIYGPLYDKLFHPEQGSCYVETEYPDVYKVLNLIHSSGGIAVFAHPHIYNSFDLLQELCEKRLIDGIEVWHGKATQDDEAQLQEMCDTYHLIPTGGSDFHGMYSSRPVSYTHLDVYKRQTSAVRFSGGTAVRKSEGRSFSIV